MSGTHSYTATVATAWMHTCEDGSGDIACFTLTGHPDRAFWGPSDWLPLLSEAIELTTAVRVEASTPEPVSCGDPHCGDGCCDDPNCTNVPEEEREATFLLRCDTIQWL